MLSQACGEKKKGRGGTALSKSGLVFILITSLGHGVQFGVQGSELRGRDSGREVWDSRFRLHLSWFDRGSGSRVQGPGVWALRDWGSEFGACGFARGYARQAAVELPSPQFSICDSREYLAHKKQPPPPWTTVRP